MGTTPTHRTRVRSFMKRAAPAAYFAGAPPPTRPAQFVGPHALLRGGIAPYTAFPEEPPLDAPDGEMGGGGASDGPELQYYNLLLTAPVTSGDVVPDNAPIASFTESRGQPVILKANNFDLTIVRWQTVGLDLPTFIPSIQTGQDDPTLTVYRVTLSAYSQGYDALVTFTQAVTWVPQYDEAAPGSPRVQQQLTDGSHYYWCRDVDWFNALVNRALDAAVTGFNALYATASGGDVPALLSGPPTLFMNGNTMSMAYDPQCWGLVTQSVSDAPTFQDLAYKQVFLSFNAPLYQLYQGFSGRVGPVRIPTGGGTAAFPDGTPMTPAGATSLLFPLAQLVKNNYIAYSPNQGQLLTNLLLWDTSFNPLDQWSPVDAVSFNTQMPVQSEESTPPALLGAGSFVPTTARQFTPQMTDIALALLGGATDYREKILYSPPGEYRWTSINGAGALDSLTFTVYWKCRLNGVAYAVRLLPSGSVQVTLLFRRRF